MNNITIINKIKNNNNNINNRKSNKNKKKLLPQNLLKKITNKIFTDQHNSKINKLNKVK